jgi:hypothetical protein
MVIPVEISMTIDPALTTNRRSDATAACIVGCDFFENWWVLVCRKYKAVPSVVSERLLRLIGMFQPRTVLIESAMADVEMVARLQAGIAENQYQTSISSYHPLVDEKKGERGKPARIEGLEGRFVDRKIFLQIGGCDDLEEEYVDWEGVDGGKDDALDSLAMQRRAALPSRHSSIEQAEGALEDDPDEYDSPWEKQAAERSKGGRNVIAQVGRSSLALRA